MFFPLCRGRKWGQHTPAEGGQAYYRLASSALKLFEEQTDVEKSPKRVVLKLGRPRFKQFHE